MRGRDGATFAAGAGVGALVGMALLAGAMYTTDWRGDGAEQPEPSSRRALQEGGQCYSAEEASGIAVRAVDAVSQTLESLIAEMAGKADAATADALRHLGVDEARLDALMQHGVCRV